MKQFLKGNYTVEAVIADDAGEEGADGVEAFEKTALAKLGGSICFVSKKGFLWKGEAAGGSGTKDRKPA
jgi:hypothetical protein